MRVQQRPDNQLEEVELSQGSRQVQVALGDEEILDELVGRHEEHRVAGLDQGVTGITVESVCDLAASSGRLLRLDDPLRL